VGRRRGQPLLHAEPLVRLRDRAVHERGSDRVIWGGINLYTFANNDPVNGSDPLGLDPCPGPVGILAVCDPVQFGRGGPVGFWPLSWAWWRDNFGGRGSGGNPYNDWERLGGKSPGGGGNADGSGSAKRPLMTRECFSAGAMFAVTAVTDFTVVGPAARAGVMLGARAFSHAVSGLGVDALRGVGYINASQYRRIAAQTWGASFGYSAATGVRTSVVAAEAVGAVDLGLDSGDLSGWDFVPYLATLRSLDRAIQACL
jgi:hypothetical protein